MGYDWNTIKNIDWKTQCREGKPCFAQLPLSTGGMKCTALEETYAKRVECPFAKENRGNRQTYKMERKQKTQAFPGEEPRKRRAVYRTSSGVVFG